MLGLRCCTGFLPLRRVGFSSWGLLLWWSTGPRVRGLQQRRHVAQQALLAGSRAQAQKLWHTGLVAPWRVDLPGPGMEPVSPHQQTDSQPLEHQGSLITPCFLKHCFPLLISHLLVWSPLLSHISGSVSSPKPLNFEVLSLS